jgi:S1-C subfamily serine protease
MAGGRFCCLVFLLCCASTRAQTVASPPADDLPRHGVIGLVVGAADSAKPESPLTNPPTVKTIVPGGSGEAAGIQPGDILVELNGQPIASAADFALRISRHLGFSQNNRIKRPS